MFFFFNAPAPTEIYTLSLHDALPIYPPVGDARHPPLDDLALAAHPYRYRPLDGQGIDAGVGDAMVLSGERHELSRPQRAHHLDLLLDPPSACGEVFAERLELDRVPAD